MADGESRASFHVDVNGATGNSGSAFALALGLTTEPEPKYSRNELSRKTGAVHLHKRERPSRLSPLGRSHLCCSDVFVAKYREFRACPFHHPVRPAQSPEVRYRITIFFTSAAFPLTTSRAKNTLFVAILPVWRRPSHVARKVPAAASWSTSVRTIRPCRS